jgi:hypothetical protein
MHGVLMAAHGVFDGLLGLATLVQVAEDRGFSD